MLKIQFFSFNFLSYHYLSYQYNIFSETTLNLSIGFKVKLFAITKKYIYFYILELFGWSDNTFYYPVSRTNLSPQLWSQSFTNTLTVFIQFLCLFLALVKTPVWQPPSLSNCHLAENLCKQPLKNIIERKKKVYLINVHPKTFQMAFLKRKDFLSVF